MAWNKLRVEDPEELAPELGILGGIHMLLQKNGRSMTIRGTSRKKPYGMVLGNGDEALVLGPWPRNPKEQTRLLRLIILRIMHGQSFHALSKLLFPKK